MVVKIARIFLYCICFIGFLFQCWELFFKFVDGTTTIVTSNAQTKSGLFNFPRFSICLDPPTSLSRMSKLGLSAQAWDIKENENQEWPIQYENQSNLFDLSMFSFEEIFSEVRVLESSSHLKWKETNTWFSGKCFTFLGDEISATTENTISIKLNPVFDDALGKFKIFIHDLGMELSLVNQWWINPHKLIFDVLSGSVTDITFEKHLHEKMAKHEGSTPTCRKDWSSLDFYTCLDDFLVKIREPFLCRSPFDFSLNQSALMNQKPICTSWNETKLLIETQSSVFWKTAYSKECIESCNHVTYKPSISSNKVFGRSHTTIYLYYTTTNTVVETEVLVYDKITIISAIGGSLGLFLGFSVLSVGLSFLRQIQDKK